MVDGATADDGGVRLHEGREVGSRVWSKSARELVHDRFNLLEALVPVAVNVLHSEQCVPGDILVAQTPRGLRARPADE